MQGGKIRLSFNKYQRLIGISGAKVKGREEEVQFIFEYDTQGNLIKLRDIVDLGHEIRITGERSYADEAALGRIKALIYVLDYLAEHNAQEGNVWGVSSRLKQANFGK